MLEHSGYDFQFTLMDGTVLQLSTLQGKVILIVNTASFCGFTAQYAGLQELHERYKDQGLIIIGVPCNDFGQQEPENGQCIVDFTQKKFNVDFILTEKTSIKGPNAHPFYQWAEGQFNVLAKPRWNFHKYLISKEGQLIDWFASTRKPSSPKIIQAIENALKA